MQFRTLAPLALASAAFAAYSNGTVSTITYETTVEEVVTALTTYCPEATTIVTNGETYTVTSATTLTITNCPCTKEEVITTTTVTTVPTTSTGVSSVAPSSAPVISTAENAGAKVGAAGLAAVAGRADAQPGAGAANGAGRAVVSRERRLRDPPVPERDAGRHLARGTVSGRSGAPVLLLPGETRAGLVQPSGRRRAGQNPQRQAGGAESGGGTGCVGRGRVGAATFGERAEHGQGRTVGGPAILCLRV
ncbi:hypothetical protein KL948_002240 [Ogataea haglerorum]|uniref:uncharacterized protein n=1 Tax=Ogataea haglerorum TaxID=1937702 RepID=UPI001C8A3194|nr:uncharacterized protein KL911_002259 [Ogataea haglerorum]KAG7732042.1 hypothetical protein KL948_002240 [Ogataea haglerorum]KAG7754820.1 hypothetical protein KL911_002259 [Ogataea haglerorum]KAG7802721.1 hypothetical protein KL944_002368 [Ogataea haglerorum]